VPPGTTPPGTTPPGTTPPAAPAAPAKAPAVEAKMGGDTAAISAYPPGTIAPLDPELRQDSAQYRGRENPTTAAEGLAWIPRVLFFPAFLVTEYGVRIPIYKAAEFVDRKHVVPIVQKIFNPHPQFFWSPTISLDLGAITFVGVQARFEDVGVEGHQIKLAAAFGGTEAWRVKGQDRWQLGDNAFVGIRGAFEKRWDRPFFGFGPYSRDFRTNFALARGDAFLFGGVEAGNHFRLQLAPGYRQERTSKGGNPSIEVIAFPEDIPAYGEELHLAVAMLDLKLDSRTEADDNGGVRLLANGTYARDVLNRDRAFLTLEADLEAAVEVSYPDRVLAARLYAADTVPLGDDPIPFTHLPMLGGPNHHGFVWARFRDESAVMAEARYRYPIAYYMDAQLSASAGNVFARHFEDFDLGALTASLGAGLRTRRIGPAPIELTFAVGTSRFDERFAVESFRVYFSTTDGL